MYREGSAKLSEEQVKDIISRLHSGETSNHISESYLVGTHAIYNIRRFWTWKNVPRPAPMKGYLNQKLKSKEFNYE